MNLYILRWNPNISSYKTEDHVKLVSHIKNNEQPSDFNWSIREFENLKKDDMFILQQVGTDHDGIAMIGKFKDSCYEDESWRKDGSKNHYADMWIMDAFDCNAENPLSANHYEQLFPEISWHGGHSGEMVGEPLDDKLINEIEKDLINAGIWKKGELEKFMSWSFEDEFQPKLDDDGIKYNNEDSFADETALLKAKELFLNNRDEESFANLICCLKKSKVLIPMRIEKDDEGKEVCYPVCVSNQAGEQAYPIFSTEEQSFGYFKNDEPDIYEIPVPLAIEITMEDEEANGLVLDPNNGAFFIDKDLGKVILELKFKDEDDSEE